MLEFVDPEGYDVTVPGGRPHLIDAVMGMTRASLGRGSLHLGERMVVRLVNGGACHDYPV